MPSTLRNHARWWMKPVPVVVAVFLLLLAVAYFMILTPATSGIKEDTALMQVKVLTRECEAYRMKHARFPANLEVLLQKDEFGVLYVDDSNALFDPWVRPYQYNAKGPRNNGARPDIWTVAPDGQEIGNWPRK